MKVVLPAFGGHTYQGPWPLVPLQHVAQVQAGDGISADRITEAGPVPVFGGNGVRGYTERHNVEGARVLVGRQGALCGNVHLTRGRIWATEHALVITPERDTDASWLRYALEAADLGRLSIASAQPGITRTAVQTDLLPFAPPALREGMSDYLDRETAEIDAMDADLDRLVETLRERQRSVLLKLGQRLSAPGERTRLGYLLVKQAREVRAGDGVVTAFRDGQVTLRSKRREDGFTVSFTESGYQGVEPGDFVFHGLDGFAGAVGVSEDRGKASPVYHVCSAADRTSETFMAWALRAMAASGLLEAYAWSVRQRSVDYRNWATFAGLPLTYIEPEDQERIVAELDEQTAQIDGMIADANRLKGLLAQRRSTIITDVVTGKKEVPA